MKSAIKHLVDIPESLKTEVVFDQSVFVKLAISNVTREASIGLVLTGLMILIFLGSPRPRSPYFCLFRSAWCSAPGYQLHGGSINTMILGGLALVFSRLIDNGVIVLENIFRHMEMGEPPDVAAERGGTEVSMAYSLPRSPPPSCFFQSHSLMESANIYLLLWRSASCCRSSPHISLR